MVINQKQFTIPNMYQIRGSYLMYKLGESICYFIDSAYGSDKLVRLLENWHKERTFDKVVKLTLGDDLSELSRKWEYYLKNWKSTISRQWIPSSLPRAAFPSRGRR